MSKENQYDIAVVGAGIVGLAIAYRAAQKGLKVAVFERNSRSLGASIRNFGLIWPIGQRPGRMLDRAMRSRETWLQLAEEAGLWVQANGSLHLAYQHEELAVLEEFYDTTRDAGYQCRLLSAQETPDFSTVARRESLQGALWSETELTVSPRQALPRLADFLAERYGVEFHWGACITHVNAGYLSTFYEQWKAGRIYICSGVDFETLYPQEFSRSGMLKCKLQMMRTSAQPGDWKMGPSLCAGLTLRHYAAFSHCTTLGALGERYDRELPDYKKYGIHVLLSQNQAGEMIIGDSHEYGKDISPFDSEKINTLIVDYLKTFAQFPDWQIGESWHGIYPSLPGKTELVLQAEPNVWIVNGLSGAGMSLSFGLATEILEGTYME